MSLSIRLANNHDIPAVTNVIKAVYDEYGWAWDPEGYHDDLYDIEGYYFAKGNQFWIADWDGEPAGTVALETFPLLVATPGAGTCEQDGMVRAANTDCSAERLYVSNNFRRRGIASALMQTVLEEARKLGCTGMEVWTDKRLKEAHLLYEKLGAEIIGERICDDPEQSPEWGMRLAL
jgi:putative acetyltransferase